MKKGFNFKMNLQGKIVFTVILSAVVPLVVMFSIFYYYFNSSLIKSEKNKLRGILMNKKIAVEETFTNLENTIDLLSEDATIKEMLNLINTNSRDYLINNKGFIRFLSSKTTIKSQ